MSTDTQREAAERAAFVARLRSLGLSGADLAAVAGVDESNAYRWLSERHRQVPHRKHAEAIAAHAGVSADWLLTGEGERAAPERRQAYADFRAQNGTPQPGALTPEQAARAEARRRGAPPRLVEVEGDPGVRSYLVTVDGQPDRYVIEVFFPDTPVLEIGDALRAARVRD